jgi:hypothetical protein
MMSHLVPNAVAAEVILKLGALVADIIVHVHFSSPGNPSFVFLYTATPSAPGATILEPPHQSYFYLQAANIRSRL